MNTVHITGTGSFLPPRVLTNQELAKTVDTSDEWITTRTGIKERRIADDKTATSDMAFEAAKQALQSAKLLPQDLDLIIVATCTPDHFFPSVACIIQEALGAKNAAAFDLSAACSGFMYSLATARSFLLSQTYRNALVIGADMLSKFTDWTDRSTCVLFGDGAGALILERGDTKDLSHLPQILSIDLGADGSQSKLLRIPAGGSRNPWSRDKFESSKPYIQMDGKEVYRHAVTRMIETANAALNKAGRKSSDLALLIPHQANLRIIESIAKRMAVPMEKVFLNIHRFGNMSAATTIVALDEVWKSNRLKTGDLLELIAFGAGFTWGSVVIEW